jgi:hypothetical protein
MGISKKEACKWVEEDQKVERRKKKKKSRRSK